eukprot:SAG11_NODE_8732_length_981_cov_13.041950_2_plen_103_part_00
MSNASPLMLANGTGAAIVHLGLANGKIDDKLRIGDGNANDPKLADRLISDVRFVLFSNPQQFDALIPVFEMAMEVAKDQFAYNWYPPTDNDSGGLSEYFFAR